MIEPFNILYYVHIKLLHRDRNGLKQALSV
jgi:hypothetical protein